jgi:hypothetical protein
MRHCTTIVLPVQPPSLTLDFLSNPMYYMPLTRWTCPAGQMSHDWPMGRLES